ncbi:hypothetical protein JOB18_004937 [Solea senegalensis]|uniref:Uncharacterized protein n=1 Tax=Solea senegalensis TaxID=28829 RepID=A0AAV6R2L9_SOLSE|nr:hypothetical protein JOB18_004937 [Solea senegalensis]
MDCSSAQSDALSPPSYAPVSRIRKPNRLKQRRILHRTRLTALTIRATPTLFEGHLRYLLHSTTNYGLVIHRSMLDVSMTER